MCAEACAEALVPENSLSRDPKGSALPFGSRLSGARNPADAPARALVVLDLCAGTGDLALAVARAMPAARVLACDFSRPMLQRAAAKFARAGVAGRTALLEADALALPLPDGSVDAITCAFGLRNLADPAAGLAEMVRVLRPGGAAVILEFHPPPRHGALAAAFRLYFRRILPTLGGWISGGGAPAGRGGPGGYRYLVDSVEAFGPPEATADAMRRAGLAEVAVEPLTAGVVSLFLGRKAPLARA
jgi:demethylmenaquinone methyltransferase/2-methoxy-6-polyprenyl-1,4-benzoquinol methylase